MYLLDTHAIIWYVIGSTELSATVRNLMETNINNVKSKDL